jgi:hypothetical protein
MKNREMEVLPSQPGLEGIEHALEEPLVRPSSPIRCVGVAPPRQTL